MTNSKSVFKKKRNNKKSKLAKQSGGGWFKSKIRRKGMKGSVGLGLNSIFNSGKKKGLRATFKGKDGKKTVYDISKKNIGMLGLDKKDLKKIRRGKFSKDVKNKLAKLEEGNFEALKTKNGAVIRKLSRDKKGGPTKKFKYSGDGDKFYEMTSTGKGKDRVRSKLRYKKGDKGQHLLDKKENITGRKYTLGNKREKTLYRNGVEYNSRIKRGRFGPTTSKTTTTEDGIVQVKDRSGRFGRYKTKLRGKKTDILATTNNSGTNIAKRTRDRLRTSLDPKISTLTPNTIGERGISPYNGTSKVGMPLSSTPETQTPVTQELASAKAETTEQILTPASIPPPPTQANTSVVASATTTQAEAKEESSNA